MSMINITVSLKNDRVMTKLLRTIDIVVNHNQKFNAVQFVCINNHLSTLKRAFNCKMNFLHRDYDEINTLYFLIFMSANAISTIMNLLLLYDIFINNRSETTKLRNTCLKFIETSFE